jgi:hypothetical protein
MAEPSPARFFATLIGTLLVVIGILGFFGLFGNDAWLDALHMATGALGLALASQAPRAFA